MDPFGEGLVANLIRFSHLLRENSLPVPLSSLLDALKSLTVSDISQREVFYYLLRSNLVCRKEDLGKFDELFYQFWMHHKRVSSDSLSKHGDETEGEEEPGAFPGTREVSIQTGEDKSTDAGQQQAILYSPHPLHRKIEGDDVHLVGSRALYESIYKLLLPLNSRLSRRFRYAVHGKAISLRRILRKNMQFGGELIFLDFKKRKLKRRRVIFFCDVSGSMDQHTLMILQFAHALKRIDTRTEIFFFSTELTRATPLFDLGEFPTTLSRLRDAVTDWGGGTRIGHCVRTFQKIYGKRLLSNKAIVMIFSDGWDRGEIDLLERQMSYLERKEGPQSPLAEPPPWDKGLRADLYGDECSPSLCGLLPWRQRPP